MKTAYTSAILALGVLTAAAQSSFTISLAPVPGGTGTGSGTLTLYSDNTFDYNITFSGMTGDYTMSHIHRNAGSGVVVGLTRTSGTGTSGVLSGAGVAFPPADLANLLNGETYVNIHSDAFTGGEIRGDVVPVPEPSALALGGLTLGLLAMGRKRLAKISG